MHIKMRYSIITFKKASQNQTTKINNAKPQLLLHHANTVESPLDCKEIHPVILKEISPEYSLEGLMLKLKLQ